MVPFPSIGTLHDIPFPPPTHRLVSGAPWASLPSTFLSCKTNPKRLAMRVVPILVSFQRIQAVFNYPSFHHAYLFDLKLSKRSAILRKFDARKNTMP